MFPESQALDPSSVSTIMVECLVTHLIIHGELTIINEVRNPEHEWCKATFGKQSTDCIVCWVIVTLRYR